MGFEEAKEYLEDKSQAGLRAADGRNKKDKKKKSKMEHETKAKQDKEQDG